MPTETVSD